MAKLTVLPGSTSISLLMRVIDAQSPNGGGKTGLAYNTSGLACAYARPGSAATSVTLASQTAAGAWTSGGFCEISSSLLPGLYRIDVPDAVFVSGVSSAVVQLGGVSGCIFSPMEIDLSLGKAVSDLSVSLSTVVPVTSGATGFTLTYGSIISGTYSNTTTLDGTQHVLAPAVSTGLDAYYTFEAGTGRAPVGMTVNGHFNGSGQYADVYAYNYSLATWDKLSNSSTRMATRNADTSYSYQLNRENMDTVTNIGRALIRFVSPSTNTGHRLYIDTVRVSSVSAATGSTAPAGLTAQQVWEYITRTLTTSTGDPATPTEIADATCTAFGFPTADLDSRLSGISSNLADVSLASQIPANFTDATFVSAGVFATSALANAPVTSAQDIWEYSTRALTDKADFTLASAYDAAKNAASQSSVDDIPTNAELATALANADDAVLAAIAALNNLSADDAQSAVSAALSSYHVATQSMIAALHDFNPATDVVARVTLTDTTTTLTNAPDVPSAGDIADAVREELTEELAHLDEDVSSRSSQLSVDELPTNSELAAALSGADDAVLSAIGGLNNFDPATDTVARVTLVDTVTTLTNAPDVPSAENIASAVRTELAAELAHVDEDVSSRASQSSVDDIPTNAELAVALSNLPGFSLSTVLEGDMQFGEAMRVILAALSGKTAGVGTLTEHYKSLDGTKDRLVVTFDSAGNRLTVVFDGE